jgi:hypothetical protein
VTALQTEPGHPFATSVNVRAGAGISVILFHRAM